MTAVAPFEIAGRRIGPEHPPYVIAEVSANHCQDLDLARRIVLDCAAAGVDAVKLQTYSPDTITLDVDLPPYRISGGTWDGERLYQLYQRAMTPWDWTAELMSVANDSGVHLFSTPFDPTAVDYLESCGVPAFKVASFELTYHPLLERIGRTGKPVIMSTGLSTREEIAESVRILLDSGAPQVALLKCTSAYPASVTDLNLTLIPQMVQDFGVPIGYSDHTIGNTASVAAVALGACIIEKHVKDAASTGSADESFSTLPGELANLVQACREAQQARGSAAYGPTESEVASLHFRRSIVAARDIRAGAVIAAEDLVIIRPNIGAAPRELGAIVGRPAGRDYLRGEGVLAPDA
jgi:N-acetylneuraminate synthase